MKMDQKHAYLENARQLLDLQARIKAAMDIITKYGGIDGAHHKTWVIDQSARALLGDEYQAWVAELRSGEDGPETYEYDEGINP